MNKAKLDIQLAQISPAIEVTPGHDALLQNLERAYPDLEFSCVLTRCGWYRVGGVVDASGHRIAENLAAWVEQQCGGDIGLLWDKFADAGYRATRLSGRTHYFVAPSGAGSADFVQLEVEEVQEETDRLIGDPAWLPDTVEEFIDPVDYPRLEPQPVENARYLLRRITPIAAYLDKLARKSESPLPIRRFLRDWEKSSAGEAGPLCYQWVFNLREYTDGYGEPMLQVRPMSTFTGELAEVDPDASVRGANLANLIHGFDRTLGYPMAWYFYLLTRKKVSPRVADAIHNDLMGAYAYLPPRDLKVLNAWIDDPYAV